MPRRKPTRWSMYPQLHSRVSELLEEDGIRFGINNTDDDFCIKDYDTNVMGRFSCNNSKCESTGWSSKKIAVTIRMYEGSRYNARIHHQHCKDCNSLSRPSLDDKSYADRIAYRLKKWRGIKMEQPHYSGESKGPHEKSLCEGCKAGHYTQITTKTFMSEMWPDLLRSFRVIRQLVQTEEKPKRQGN